MQLHSYIKLKMVNLQSNLEEYICNAYRLGSRQIFSILKNSIHHLEASYFVEFFFLFFFTVSRKYSCIWMICLQKLRKSIWIQDSDILFAEYQITFLKRIHNLIECYIKYLLRQYSRLYEKLQCSIYFGMLIT